jgi:hypothetical protein
MHKIYWYGFKRQLNEFYLLLRAEGIISCALDEFFSHFTGKKLAIEEDYTSKIKWHGNLASMEIVIDHLAAMRFLQKEDTELKVFASHFRITEDKINIKQLQKNLELLFPATSGYRCKERLFYKARNKSTPITKLFSDFNLN